MSVVPGIPNPYLGAFAGGLIYGFAFCTAACLPYVAGYIAGVGAGFRRGVAITLTYNAGRIAAYAVIGALVATLGGLLKFLWTEESLLPLQGYASIAFGIVTIAIGVSIILKIKSGSCEGHPPSEGGSQLDTTTGRFDVRAFFLGLSRGFVLCPPLIALLIYSLAFATPIEGLILAILFGIGTALSPLLLLGGATGWLLGKAPLFRKWISLGGAIVLMAFGFGTMLMALAARYP
jgi:thiol:disulfide interchange protein DsbD